MHQQGLASRSLLVLAMTILLLAPGSVPVRAQSSDAFVPVTDAMLQDPAPDDWLMWRRRLIPAPGEPGNQSWDDVPFAERKHVGAWMVPSYDPALNLVYIGTSVTSPAPKFMLGGNDATRLHRAPTRSAPSRRFLSRPGRSSGSTSSGPARHRSSQPGADWCSAAMGTAGFGPWTTRRARCCGRSIWARRSRGFRLRTPSTDGNMWRSAPGRR